MNRVSEKLREASKEHSHQPYPDAPLSAEDIEAAKRCMRLAQKNDRQELTIEEAQEIQDLFEREGDRDEGVAILCGSPRFYVDYTTPEGG